MLASNRVTFWRLPKIRGPFCGSPYIVSWGVHGGFLQPPSWVPTESETCGRPCQGGSCSPPWQAVNLKGCTLIISQEDAFAVRNGLRGSGGLQDRTKLGSGRLHHEWPTFVDPTSLFSIPSLPPGLKCGLMRFKHAGNRALGKLKQDRQGFGVETSVYRWVGEYREKVRGFVDETRLDCWLVVYRSSSQPRTPLLTA